MYRGKKNDKPQKTSASSKGNFSMFGQRLQHVSLKTSASFLKG